jgi:hypothetical protein
VVRFAFIKNPYFPDCNLKKLVILHRPGEFAENLLGFFVMLLVTIKRR